MNPALVLRGGGRRWELAAGCVLVGIVALAAIFAPLLALYPPLDLDVMTMLQGPSAAHWLGTDEAGRDLLSRAMFGARISMQVAVVSAAIGLLAGGAIGIAAAYGGRWVDVVLMRAMELLFSFPAILLALVLMASVGTSRWSATLAIGIVFVPAFARLARAATETALRERYVEAARAVGMSHLRIVAREILPNIATPLLAGTASALSTAVLFEAGLAFLGLGAQIPEPSWGIMLDTGRGFLTDAPWLCIVPGLAIFITVLGFNLIGNGLRDAADPRLG